MHFVQHRELHIGGHLGFGKRLGSRPNPFQNRHIAHPQKAGDASKTHVAHRISRLSGHRTGSGGRNRRCRHHLHGGGNAALPVRHARNVQSHFDAG